MEALLKSITRKPDGPSIAEILAQTKEGEEVTIVFRGIQKQQEEQEQKPAYLSGHSLRRGCEYIIKVKRWMTQKTGDESFDFMRRWNQNIEMPLRTMRGRVLKETRGMLYMELRGCRLQTDNCIKCGRAISHPVSRLYGIGPECGKHFHINPFETEEELQNALDEVDAKLNGVTWSGWVAKSGIEVAIEVKRGANA